MLYEYLDIDFAVSEPNYFHQALIRAGEREVCVEGVENWLEEIHSDPVYQVLYTGKILESVLAGDQPGESSSSDTEDEVVVRQKYHKYEIVLTLSYNMLMQQMTVTFIFYVHLRTSLELFIIRTVHY